MIIHRCTAIQKLALQTVRLEKQLDDLRNTFIHDVERSSQCTIKAGVLELQTNVRRVEYRRDQDALVRQAFDDGGKLLEQQNWPVEVFEFQPKIDENGKSLLVHFQLRARLLTDQDANKSQVSKTRESDETSVRMIRWSVRLGGNDDVP
jgi:hypothetical protein